MAQYRIRLSDEFRAEWYKEARYSKQNWGEPHAKRYFAQLRAYYRQLLDETPWSYVNPNNGMDEGQGYIKFQGHYILFEIREQDKEVLLLDLYGRNRFFELQNMVEARREALERHKAEHGKKENTDSNP